MGIGAGRLALRRLSPGPSSKPGLYSIDVFATLLGRLSDDDDAWRAGAMRAGQVARMAGAEVDIDPIVLRREVEGEMARALMAEGRDPEFTHHRVLAAMLARLGVDGADARGQEIAAWELEREAALTYPIASAVAWVAEKLQDGHRVVAISDTRYTADELRYLFRRHQAPSLSAVYASADHGPNKFSGRLFDIVAASEGVPVSAMEHVGDNLTADILSPAHRGALVRKVRRPERTAVAQPLPRAPAPLEDASADPLFRVGYEVLGPLIVAFVRLVLHRAQLDGVDHLAFVARDGDLPLKLAEMLTSDLPDDEKPVLSYVHLSRRAVRAAQKSGEEGGEGLERLLRYLQQIDILNRRTALVDIGWGGSIRRILAAIVKPLGAPVPRGYYLGLYDEKAPTDTDPDVHGLLCDQRLGRDPVEGAAWQAAYILEALCRARHGTVIGYEDAAGTICPIHADAGGARRAEVLSEPAQERVRAGVLAYGRWWASVGQRVPPDMKSIRRAAQRRLFGLAFFPSADERRLGRLLFHTEADSDETAVPLAAARGDSLRTWLAGIRSPWKGAYFMEAGGPIAAALHCAAESVLSAMPPGWKIKIRNVVFRTDNF